MLRRYKKPRRWVVLALVCVVTKAALTTALAQPVQQSAAEIAQEQRRQQEREQAERQRLERTPDVRLPAGGPAVLTSLPKNEFPCFRLTEFEVVGKDAPLFKWLLLSLAGANDADSPVGQCVGAQGVGLLIQRAQDVLVAKGFVTSRVLAQPQNLASGKLQLVVVAGRVRAVRFAQPLDQRATKGTTWSAVPAKPGDILNLRDIEQALENFKRVPTAEADIKITPADADASGQATPDQSDLLISYKQAFPLRATLSFDDSGAKSTGKYQSSLSVSFDNLLTLNDLLYVTLSQDMGGAQTPANISGKAQGTRGNTAHYSVPFGYWAASATLSNSNYFQTVAGLNQNYVYRGTSSNAEVKLQRLVYRNANRKTTLSVKAFQRRSKNLIDDTEVQVQRRSVGGWEAGLGHREFIGQSTLDINAAYRKGTGAFGSLPAPEELFNEGTSRFGLATFDINLSVPFKLGDQRLRYGAMLRGQSNGTTLTPQDRFAVGGRYSVRGFDGESALSAERGWVLRNELGLTLGDASAELYAALDHGEVAGPSAAFLAGKSLTGAALGLRGAYKNVQYDFYVGAPVRKPALFRTSNSVAGFMLSISF